MNNGINNGNGFNQNVTGNDNNQQVQPQVQPQIQPLPTPQNVSNPVTPTPTVTNTSSPSYTSSTSSPQNPSMMGNTDPGAVVNENLKKVDINYTPPSKFKVFSMIVFFILLVVFVLFLPEITSYVNKIKSGEMNQANEKITTGMMKCTLSSHTTNLDKDYEVTFSFKDNQLESTKFLITTRGDITEDETELNKLNDVCTKLSENVKDINGVSISCDYTTGQLIEKQNFQLKELNDEELDAAFVEAGGNNPGYSYGQDMDNVEKQMNASKYTCERSR